MAITMKVDELVKFITKIDPITQNNVAKAANDAQLSVEDFENLCSVIALVHLTETKAYEQGAEDFKNHLIRSFENNTKETFEEFVERVESEEEEKTDDC